MTRLTRAQQQVLFDVHAGRVWADRTTGAWTILDNETEGEGDALVNPRTVAALVRRGLTCCRPHQSSRHLQWVYLTAAGEDELDRIIARAQRRDDRAALSSPPWAK